MLGDSRSLQLKGLTQTEIYISQTIADQKVKSLKPRARKCLYNDEPISSYFDYYTKNVCQMSCRIKNAQKACGCVPFIYKMDKKPICNVTGMSCLAENFEKWYPRKIHCYCPEMCESITMSVGITNPEAVCSYFG